MTLWESLHEHGLAPEAADAAAAVRAAVELGDGGAAVRLLMLACMYGEAPLAGAAEAGAVLQLLQQGGCGGLGGGSSELGSEDCC